LKKPPRSEQRRVEAEEEAWEEKERAKAKEKRSDNSS
jgi:hypothetical protein